ncbi:MAG: hypothetical protein ACRCXT_04390 [Paraclostridium sp.]
MDNKYIVIGFETHALIEKVNEVLDIFECICDISNFEIKELNNMYYKFIYIPINIYYCTKNIWNKKFKSIKINIRNNC